MESKNDILEDFCKYLRDTGTEINTTDIDDYFCVRKKEADIRDGQLTIPVVSARNCWWEEYPRLSSSEFTIENSGNKLCERHPYSEGMEGGLKNIIGVSSMFNVLGYTLSPPFTAPFESVAIMFERKDDFSKQWFHYVR